MSKNRLKNLVLDELSLVDEPANEQSRVSIIKRKSEESQQNSGNQESEMDKAKHGDMSDKEKARMRELMEKEGMEEKEAADQAKREMRKDAGSPGENEPSKTEKSAMTVEDLQKRLGDLENQVTQITKQAEDNGLTVEKSDDGNIKLSKAKEEEYVTVGGEQVAKSQVPSGVLKAIESQQAEIAKMQKERETENLRKRADKELPHLKGTADERGALLKAVDSIESEETRNAVMETLKAADGFTAASFTEVGKSLVDDETTATAQLEKRVNDYAKEQNLDYYTAFDEVTKSDEGKTLLTKSRQEKRGQVN